MKKTIFTLFSCLTLFGCSVEPKEVSPLIKTENEFLMDADERAQEYYLDRTNFIQPYISYNQKKEVLEVSTVHLVNACAPVRPSIKIVKDTIWLNVEVDYSGESCMSEELRIFKYFIKNPDKKKYVIIY